MITSSEGARAGMPLAESLPTQQTSAKSLIDLIKDCLEDNKAESIISIDLAGKSSMGDMMVIASGRSQTHVGAIAEKLTKELKTAGYGNAHVEGLPHCDWVLIDTGDIIIHLFRPEVREFYNLEKIWSTERPIDASVDAN